MIRILVSICLLCISSAAVSQNNEKPVDDFFGVYVSECDLGCETIKVSKNKKFKYQLKTALRGRYGERLNSKLKGKWKIIDHSENQIILEISLTSKKYEVEASELNISGCILKWSHNNIELKKRNCNAA